MQDLTAMAYFVHVVEQGGFTAAARHLNEPLSTISRRIAELEQSLDVRLLERSTRMVRLTELGQSYFEFCRRGLQEFEGATLAIQNRQTEVSGLLRITVPPNLVEPFFLPAVIDFQALHPNAHVAILSTERYIDLHHEKIDVAFRIGTLKDSQLTTRKIASYASYLVASPGYLEGRSQIGSPEDLSSHRIIAFDGRTGPVRWSLRQPSETGLANTMSVEVLPHLAMNDFSAILTATLNGCGIALVPSILCSDHLREGRLLRVMPRWSSEAETISAVMPGKRNQSRLIRLFLDHCAVELPRSLAAAER